MDKLHWFRLVHSRILRNGEIMLRVSASGLEDPGAVSVGLSWDPALRVPGGLPVEDRRVVMGDRVFDSVGLVFSSFSIWDIDYCIKCYVRSLVSTEEIMGSGG